MTTEEMSAVLNDMGKKAKRAAVALAILPDEAKKLCLIKMADAIVKDMESIQTANAKDLELARENGLAPAMIDRLTLNSDRINAMADGMRTVAAQSDPVGKIISETVRPNGLKMLSVLFMKPVPTLPLMLPVSVSKPAMR